MKFLIDLTLDGYESPEEEREACKVFIEEQLDFSASSVRILWTEDLNAEPNLEAIKQGIFQ